MVIKKSPVHHWTWRWFSFSTDACHRSRTWERFHNINTVAGMAQAESRLVYALDNRVFMVCFATAIIGFYSQKRPGRLWSPITLGAVWPEVEWLVREANYSPVFTIKVTNYGRYTSSCSYVFITFIHETVCVNFYSHTRVLIFFPSDSPTRCCRQLCVCHLHYTMFP